MDSPFKKSSISEMCKQISSAPVVFKKVNGDECLAFYNNEDITQATKLYILFPGSSFPKYIEGNDLFNMKDCILHNVSTEKAALLYSQSNKAHKVETQEFIGKLILKSTYREVTTPSKINIQQEYPASPEEVFKSLPHTTYNKKHACAWVVFEHSLQHCYVKDLTDKTASELIIGNRIEYDVTFDSVLWAAGISSKEFTALKVVIRKMYA